VVLATTVAGCASTRYEDGAAGDATTVASVQDTSTATAITGTAAELLPQLADEAHRLSGVMIDEGDDDAVAERIDALWQAVRQEVAATRPEMLGDFDANVRRCASAVRFHRAADADKAAANLRALVDAYLG
jgi:hypothetical protein